VKIDFLKGIRLFLHPKRKSFFALKKLLGFFPKNISYYEEALHHKSFSREYKGKYHNNERLEFLGDAVLNTIVADILFKKYKNHNEGFLTTTRSKIVQREMMDKISFELGLDKLIVSSSLLKSQSQKNHVSGNALEAFIGAVYLDQGYRKTHCFIEKKIIKAYINLDVLAKKEINFKSKMLEWGQKNRVKIEYELLDSFPDNEHNMVFQSKVLLNGISAGIGTGFSKKASHQQAAKMALQGLQSDKEFTEEILALNKSDEYLADPANFANA
jgi:ribonuclease-3